MVVGEAVGLNELGLFNPVEELHSTLKVGLVMAWIVVDSPSEMVSLSAFALIVNAEGEITKTVVDNVCVQVSPCAFTVKIVTVYVVVVLGVATGLGIEVFDKFEEGDHE